MSMGSGRTGVGVPVPRSNGSISNTALGIWSAYQLTATNKNGYLTVRQDRWSPEVHPSKRTDDLASDPACSEDYYNYFPAYWYSATANATVGWYYNSATTYRAGLNVATALENIRQANTNMSTGVNNCNLGTGEFLIHGAYRGDTSKYANVDSSINCTTKFPDGQNTVSWGPIDSSQFDQNTHEGIIGATCWHSSDGHMDEGDIYLGSNVDAVTSFVSNCDYEVDLQTLATHEWGHVFGLDHETDGPDEVMYPSRPWCTLRRHLGAGDWDGMQARYP